MDRALFFELRENQCVCCIWPGSNNEDVGRIAIHFRAIHRNAFPMGGLAVVSLQMTPSLLNVIVTLSQLADLAPPIWFWS